MKHYLKHFLVGIVAATGLFAASCSDSASKGGIHGVAIDAENTEPMRGVNVQLCKQSGTILESTVTYDDGHFEFTDVTPGNYSVVISSTKYPNVKYDFSVQAGRTASFDVPMGLHVNPYMPIYLTDFKHTGVYGGSISMEIHCDKWDFRGDPPMDYGVYYSQKEQPYVSGEKCIIAFPDNRMFCAYFIGEPTTMYYVQAFIKDTKGNTYLSEIIKVTISPIIPEVQTIEINTINDSKAIITGEIIHRGNPVYTERGFIISTEYYNPTISDIDNTETKKYPIEGDELTFKYKWTDYEKGTKYYIRAYAINDIGIAYGETIVFDPSEW